MSLSFITTAISQDFHHADCVGFMLYMSTFILDCLWYSYKRTYKFFAYLACIILPHAPVYLFWDEVLYLESIGVGSRFRNVYSRHSDNLQPVATVWVFFYIHLAFITSLAWYLDLVRPGPFGVSKRWNFLFKRSYWFSHKIKRRIVTLPETYLAKRDEKYFEKLPQHGAISIQIYNVSKVFKGKGSELSTVTADVTALDSVSFDCYQGEITLVLGDNGAGKTTLMHIVAGMIGPTCGAVFVNGINVAHRIMEHHEDLALCMQDNIYFNFLTVRENISFYKKLQRNKQDDDSGFTLHQIMKKLKLYDVADNYCSQLSSGTLRCVQVACVLAVSPDVLVLDEPTTGMDIDVKHRLWDMLFVLRSKKTIIMTTSCLEEAYALGDRIVILQNGALKCHGSPTFLKDAIGMSFSLSITIKDGTQMMKLKETVEGIIPNLRCRIEDMRNVVFSLPTKETQNFPKVFRTLEEKKEDLGIQLVDVGMFMEEVFMEFIEKPDVRYSGVADKSYMIFRAAKLEGIHLLWSRIKLLHQRTYDYLVMKKIQFLSIRVLVPTLCLIIMTVTSNYSLRSTKLFTHHVSGEDEKLGLNKLVYNVGPFRRQGLYNGAEKYPGLKLVYALDIDQEFQNPKSGFSAKDVAGFKVTDRFSKIFHPRDLKSTSKSVNMFSNIYMSMFLPNMTHGIRTSYKPILRNNTKKPKINVPKSIFLCMKWSVWVSILSILPLTPIIILCIVELNRGIRDNHMMAGCNPTLHWACKLSAHMGIYSVTILLPVIVIGVMLDFDKTFYQFKFLGSILLLIIAFGLAFLSQLYLLSFFLNENLAISQIYVLSLFFGLILPIVSAVLESEWRTSVFVTIPFFIIMLVGRLCPIFPFTVGLCRLTLQARLNAYCNLNKRKCPNLIVFDEPAFDVDFCCGKFEDDLLLVNNVHKEYFRHVHRWAPRNGVKGVTFGVKQEQCLAILGYQATGKSSLLNMLAGNLVMSKGSAYVAGYHIRKNRIKYLHNISLSSASGGMDGFMTGAQNLIFIAQMRGFESRIAYKIAYVTLRYLGIHGLQGLVEHYSAGCLRRLSLCGSLVKGPAVVFVDEPMRGIDPTSKVLVAKALRRLVLQPAAVIVAETSVAWRILQPVITRIAIMSKGQLALIGPAQEVLESIATGYTVRIKLKTMTAYRSDRYRALPSDDEMSATSTSSNDEPAIHTDKSVMIASNISDFKKDFLKEFPTSQQTGEHLSMLYFAIHDESEQKKQLYSDMFAKLQELQEKYDDVVEDCYLNATTIEDVFLRLQTQKAPQTDRHRSSSIVID
ncbi:ATP-binding cassette sub-family A member 3-like isoform X2 [Spodoptera litura]|uniref:ATP-binding cassette sub-family A member 3-like isoform X2 n=1 Tax=Spodoptera litura TaxID=69820 RepID=A0A9J7EVT6_SPOLT|nr:ATP-binding cassette sub-family A member 3-like isoform X2 [Spodoptera litura]